MVCVFVWSCDRLYLGVLDLIVCILRGIYALMYTISLEHCLLQASSALVCKESVVCR